MRSSLNQCCATCGLSIVLLHCEMCRCVSCIVQPHCSSSVLAVTQPFPLSENPVRRRSAHFPCALYPPQHPPNQRCWWRQMKCCCHWHSLSCPHYHYHLLDCASPHRMNLNCTHCCLVTVIHSPQAEIIPVQVLYRGGGGEVEPSMTIAPVLEPQPVGEGHATRSGLEDAASRCCFSVQQPPKSATLQ